MSRVERADTRASLANIECPHPCDGRCRRRRGDRGTVRALLLRRLGTGDATHVQGRGRRQHALPSGQPLAVQRGGVRLDQRSVSQVSLQSSAILGK
jgi:hypothetical protein